MIDPTYLAQFRSRLMGGLPAPQQPYGYGLPAPQRPPMVQPQAPMMQTMDQRRPMGPGYMAQSPGGYNGVSMGQPNTPHQSALPQQQPSLASPAARQMGLGMQPNRLAHPVLNPDMYRTAI